MKKIILVIVCVLLLCGCGEKKEVTENYKIEIDVKDYGVIKASLDGESAPITVDNFVKLVKDGFYDGLTFHRIIEGFMIQGGDPNHDGTGGSDETIKGEFKNNGVNNDLSHTRGAISMARSSDMNSASSQFFIVQKDSEYLDGDYAVFGYVTEGMDIVDKIVKDAKPTDDNGTIKYEEQPVINSIKVVK
ncbi:MAG: peptidylprolyl isomerase [Bacilli bacterium]|nr:peptidylprolyl isomerase [Bacilli bacterium]MBR3162017.1 peptidylprolyl isomerase [Bacilli bacterium]